MLFGMQWHEEQQQTIALLKLANLSEAGLIEWVMHLATIEYSHMDDTSAFE